MISMIVDFMVGRFRPFYRPRRPLGRVEVAPLCFLDLDTRRWWGVSVTPRPLSTPGKDPVPIVQEAGSSPGSVWTGAENLAPTGIRSPTWTARSQSLYQQSYPIMVFYSSRFSFIVSDICIFYPWRWPRSWSKFTGVYCEYKLILVYSCALITYLLTYSLTPWIRVIVEKLTVL
jgi:hypothetical protein